MEKTIEEILDEIRAELTELNVLKALEHNTNCIASSLDNIDKSLQEIVIIYKKGNINE